MKFRKALLLVTPMIAFAILAVGLHVGAPDTERAAMVYASQPASAHAGLAWQVVTLEDKHGVKEPVAIERMAVTARANGTQASWEGSSNADGVADIWLPLAGARETDAIDLSIRDARSGALLGEGRAAAAPDPTPTPTPTPTEPVSPFAPPMRRTGEIALDLAIYGRKLTAGFPVPIFVRATDASSRKPIAGVTIDAVTDGIKLASKRVTTDERGWAMLTATALIHSVGLDLTAEESPDAGASKKGIWGGMPEVAPGASAAQVPMRVLPGATSTFEVIGATAHAVYAEIDDREGVLSASALSLAAEGRARATVDVPKLTPGVYWLTTSGAPIAFHSDAPSTVTRPFAVATSDQEALALLAHGDDREHACAPPADMSDPVMALGPCLSTTTPPTPDRWLALDGFRGKHARDTKTHARGATIAVGALVIAAALEALLVIAGAIETRRNLKKLEEEGHSATARFNLLNIAIGVLLALLGFALIAALVLREG